MYDVAYYYRKRLVSFACFFSFGKGYPTFSSYRLVAPPFNFSSGGVGWISFAGITALIAPFAGNFSHKIGIYKMILTGLLICLLSFQLMGWFQSILLIAVSLLMLFLGVYTCQPLMFLLMGQRLPEDSIGSASSFYILACIGGGSLASIFLGPAWRSYGWHGITIWCSISLVISLFIMLIIVLKETGMQRRRNEWPRD